ncbi:imelysin family protein [Microscilla marina]|uniref:Insulin-cleaving metalloproteinase outer membrane protein n=1 Tax=Microscilla marina ATCC 23134 TaxID=313606 RepID=A1ZS51_MICM2|nr:imelysin family protein [Microscilla marina]EAY26774.1 insulin-cleaving metalloproteinase outer membrane protein [Microscilla marina ATCC 23134]
MQLIKVLPLLVFVMLLNACKKKEETTPPTPDATQVAEVLETYAKIAHQSYSDSYDKVVALKTSIDAFVANPDQAKFDAAKQAWKDAREPYGQTEVFRFYEGPIDNSATGPEGAINAWPLDENFIDYVAGNATAGIINDLTQTIDAATLRGNNEKGGEKNISIGYHAIEFLLWGQDTNPGGDYSNAGQRAFTDYTTATNADRRKTYLHVTIDLLLEDLKTVRDAWAEGASYRTSFVADGNKSIVRILTGMGSLSEAELAGERMKVALFNHDQEDEHSCFSDNTHRDIVTNAQGIYNVYWGTYGSVTGKGIASLVEVVDKELYAQIKTELEATKAATLAIQAPFDKEISQGNTAGNQRVEVAITALRAQTRSIESIAQKLNLGNLTLETSDALK